MNVRTTFIAAAISLCSIAGFAAPRLNFTRTVAAPRDLGGARNVALIYAIGDNDRITVFLEDFLDRTNRVEGLRIESIVNFGHHFIGAASDEQAIRTLQREHPADAYIGVYRFSCDEVERTAEGSERDSAGDRVKRAHRWIDATCRARLDVMNAEGKRRFSFHVTGQGTSPRVAEITREEHNIAVEQAAHFAAVSAAEAVTPRTVRESIELDADAPAFDEAYSMIVGERLTDARAIWESALRRHRNSAALQFDLGAVCEALGDVAAARAYYEEAQHLSPSESRYRSELTLFRKRNALK